MKWPERSFVLYDKDGVEYEEQGYSWLNGDSLHGAIDGLPGENGVLKSGESITAVLWFEVAENNTEVTLSYTSWATRETLFTWELEVPENSTTKQVL